MDRRGKAFTVSRSRDTRYTAGVLPWWCIAVPKGRDIHEIDWGDKRGALAPADICDNKVITDTRCLEKRWRDWCNVHMFLIGHYLFLFEQVCEKQALGYDCNRPQH